LTFYGVGLILGAGIYSILGEAAGVAGEALWLSFLVGSLAALLTGLSYAELATMYPQAGAEYVYVREAWPHAAWLPGTLGWLLAASGIATAATVAMAFAGYASRFVAWPQWVVAAALIVVATAVNVVGIREAGWVNVAFTLIEAAGLVALIVVGLRDPDLGSVFTAAPHPGVLAGAGLIFFAYLGFEDIANLAEEAERPGWSIPRAILLSVAISTLLYVLVAACSVALLEPERLAASPSPLADAMEQGAPRLAGALGGVALFATANTVLIIVAAGSRLLFGMARGGDGPPLLARTFGQSRMPVPAIVLVGVFALAFLPLGGVGFVGSVASLLALVAFAFVNGAVIRLRVSQPEAQRPFRTPLRLGRWPLLAVLGLVVIALLLTQFAPRAYVIAAAALGVSFAMQAVPWRRSHGRVERS
jgi:amino acid transporter